MTSTNRRSTAQTLPSARPRSAQVVRSPAGPAAGRRATVKRTAAK